MDTIANINRISVSIVIPLYNEVDNLHPLISRVHEAMADYEFPWELVLVDDGSVDGTRPLLQQYADEFGTHVHAIMLQRNFGQTAAMQAGIDFARGSVVVTMDGDLQNDPHDIPRMVNKLLDDKLDCLAGWRKNRKDALWMRKIPSKIANRLIAKMTGVRLHDYGCSLKAYRASVLKNIRLYGEMHRFIPAWIASVTPASRIGEMEVNHSARVAGESKYGLSRTFRVILDLLAVMFFMRFRARPGHFFGSIGLGAGFIGGLILSHLAVVKFVLGEDIGNRPLLLIGILLILGSIQFITTGILAELLSRTYFESSDRPPYFVSEDSIMATQDHKGWKAA